MSDALTDWDDDYARVSRAVSQLRTSNNKNVHREQHKASVRTGLARLKANLEAMQKMQEIDSQDANRRKLLVDNLAQQVIGDSSSLHNEEDLLGMGGQSTGGGKNLSTTAQALRYQVRFYS